MRWDKGALKVRKAAKNMKNEVEVQILVDGRPIKQHWHEEKWWAEGRKGKKYEVKVKNNTAGRLLAIISVDGLDIISGRSADNNSGGYVLNGHSSYTARGFRVNNDESQAFEFSDKEESYAVKSPTGDGNSRNCGVIGVRFIKEKPADLSWIIKNLQSLPEPRPVKRPMMPHYPWPSYPWRTNEPYCEDSAPYTVTCSSSVDSEPVSSVKLQSASVMRCCSLDLGTRFSEEKVADKVTNVEFQRGELLDEVFIYYASRKVLEKIGIDFEPEPKITLPKAFKDSPFCQPPRSS